MCVICIQTHTQSNTYIDWRLNLLLHAEEKFLFLNFRGASLCSVLGHDREEESKCMGQIHLVREINLTCLAMVNHSVKLFPHGHGPSGPSPIA